MPPRPFPHSRRPALILLAVIASSPLAAAQADTTVSLATSASPATFGSPVTLIAAVTPAGAPGRVTFFDGAAVLGTRIIFGGQAILSTRLFGTGTHSLRVHYGGNTNFAPSDSAILRQLVNPGAASRPRLSSVPLAGISLGPYLISTLAGLGFPSTPVSATSAVFQSVSSLATDPAGNVYFSDDVLNEVFRLDTGGTLTRMAGSGTQGYSGDGGPALDAQLNGPAGVALDAAGNLYIADSNNARVRRVSPAGKIVTVAGSGPCCNGLGDGGLATNALIAEPGGLAVDAAGNLYIADLTASRVRKVSSNGIITTIAGNGTPDYAGDNGPATSAQLSPGGVTVDASGNLLIADWINNRIRKVTVAGVITTVAGDGTFGYTGDGGPATSAQINGPSAVAVDAAGNFYISETGNQRIRKVSTNGAITTVAGGSGLGYNGDGIDPTLAWLATPTGVALDGSGNLYIADSGNDRIRKVAAGIISTVAGGGYGTAPSAPFAGFALPSAVVRDALGNTYIPDMGAERVYLITPSGSVSSIAGTGMPGYSGDNGPATAAQLTSPMGVAVDSQGALYIADTGNARVRKVSRGTITTVAGTGQPGYSGDGGQGINAQLSSPSGLAFDSVGNLYIADAGNSSIRKLNTTGTISTIAGNGTPGYSGDGTPAAGAQLNYPSGVAIDGSGNLYIADTQNQRIRRIALDGTISTVAGSGIAGYAGDSGPATAAQLNYPDAVATDTAGNLYIADSANNVVRAVTGGNITTIAGNTSAPFSGPVDDGPALNVYLSQLCGLTVDSTGNVYLADTYNHAVRLLTPQGGPAILAVSSSHTGDFQLGSTGQYTLTVSNMALAGATSGTVSVTESLPPGASLASLSGPGWTCNGGTCTRGDALGANAAYPALGAVVNVSPTAPSQITNQVTVSGGGASTAGALDATALTAPPVTVQTNPAGLQFSVDSFAAQTAPQTLSLTPGSHTVAAVTPQSGAPGARFAFKTWSDAGAGTHAITVTGTSATYTATFNTQYQLTTSPNPAPGGTVTPATGSFYDAGSTVIVTATPNPPYVFNSWSGSLSSNSNPLSISMGGPVTLTASFSVPGFTCDINNDSKTDVVDVQVLINEVIGLAPATHDMNHDNLVNVADVQKVINAALNLGCVY